jgi:hypothetical protein
MEARMIAWLAFVRFVSTPTGQVVVGVIGAAALFFGWLALHDAKVARNARAEVVGSLNTAAEKLGHEAVKARAPAERPGAFGRLRKHACGNCDE